MQFACLGLKSVDRALDYQWHYDQTKSHWFKLGFAYASACLKGQYLLMRDPNIKGGAYFIDRSDKHNVWFKLPDNIMAWRMRDSHQQIAEFARNSDDPELNAMASIVKRNSVGREMKPGGDMLAGMKYALMGSAQPYYYVEGNASMEEHREVIQQMSKWNRTE